MKTSKTNTYQEGLVYFGFSSTYRRPQAEDEPGDPQRPDLPALPKPADEPFLELHVLVGGRELRAAMKSYICVEKECIVDGS